MNQRPTPETDKAKWEIRERGNSIPIEVTAASFAESLERERDEAREQVAAMREAIREAHEALDSALQEIAGYQECPGIEITKEDDQKYIRIQDALAKLQPFLDQ